MTETLLSGRRQSAYSVTPPALTPNLYGWHLSGPGLVATEYADGTPGAVRGSVALPGGGPTGTRSVLIANDPLSRVGVAALAWRTGNGSLAVFDPVQSAVHTYIASVADLVSAPAWSSGRLWWVELEGTASATGVTRFYLRRSEADLTAVSTVATYDLSSTTAFAVWLAPVGLVITSSALIVLTQWDSGGGLAVPRAVRHPFAGAGASEGSPSGYSALLTSGPSGSYGIQLGAPGLVKMDDDVGSVPSAQWPTAGAWQIAVPLSASVVGAEAMLYGFDSTAVLVRAGAGATSGEPIQRVEVSSHPTAGLPDLLTLG